MLLQDLEIFLLPRLKKLVFGEVNIDMIAGPSEIGILSDGSANAKYLAIDLLSQAEHDEMASSIMITTCEEIAKQTSIEVDEFLKKHSAEKRLLKNQSMKEALLSLLVQWMKPFLL